MVNKLAVIVSLTLISLPLFAGEICLGSCIKKYKPPTGNPGRSAMLCVTSSIKVGTDFDKVTFTNHCGKRVFVVYCGELKWSKKECKDGGNDTYYTHSVNIDEGKSSSADVRKGGVYQFASCYGRIGFGTKGIKHSALGFGTFKCMKT